MNALTTAVLVSMAAGSVSASQAQPAEHTAPNAPATYRVLPPEKLYAGVAPGSEGWIIPESTDGPIVRNVVSPEYTAYVPDASRHTGTGVVIAPGGGMVMLSCQSEGVEVARWLAERGVAAFVLKYRVNGLTRKPGDPQRPTLPTRPGRSGEDE